MADGPAPLIFWRSNDQSDGNKRAHMDYTKQPPFLLQEGFEWHSIASFTELH